MCVCTCVIKIKLYYKFTCHLDGGGLVAQSRLTIATPWSVAHYAPLPVRSPMQKY